MAHDVARDCRFYIDGRDFSGDTNSVDLGLSTRGQPDDCFGQNVHLEMPGERSWSMGASGLLTYGTGASEATLHSNWNSRVSSVITMSPTGVDGDPCYFGQASGSEIHMGPGRMGEGIKWTWGGAAKDLIYRGNIIHTKASRSATGNGSAFQLGAVASGKSLYAALHVFTASGTSLIVKVQSDDNSGFSSATDRITFATVTTSVASELKSVAGAITDDYWRIVYTITGTGPYVLAVAAGII